MASRYFDVERTDRKIPLKFAKCKHYNEYLTGYFQQKNFDDIIVWCNKLDQLTTKKNCELCLNFKE